MEKLPVALSGAGPRQSAGIYQRGRHAGAHAAGRCRRGARLWWDGLDDIGKPVAAGPLQVRSISHDVRLLDDGAVGDNGNPNGVYNCDNADRVLALPDGGFMVTTVYDEAGYVLRRYSPSGQPIFAANLTEARCYAAGALASTYHRWMGAGEMGQTPPAGPAGHAHPPWPTAPKLITCPPKMSRTRPPTAWPWWTGKPMSPWGVECGARHRPGQRAEAGRLAGARGGDIAADAHGTLWVLSGQEIVSLSHEGDYPALCHRPGDAALPGGGQWTPGRDRSQVGEDRLARRRRRENSPHAGRGPHPDTGCRSMPIPSTTRAARRSSRMGNCCSPNMGACAPSGRKPAPSLHGG